jgi:hypothetical protein
LNSVERQRIDQLAPIQACTDFWHERLSLHAELGVKDTIGQAAVMVDRFHPMFQRTLRSLCSLRKVSLAVVVQRAGQVNLGG